MALPTGTVTLLFTDVEGSTSLLHALGDRYGALLVDHHRLLRAAWSEYRGVEVDTEGDAFFVAFERAGDAVGAAAAAQRALAAHAWPGGARVRVRMGIHTGEPEAADGRYVGLDVHYAARLCAAANGGQVLLSDTTQALVQAPAVDLGLHRVKDFVAPQRLHRLVVDGAPVETAPPRTLDVVRTNLPAPVALIGREDDLARVVALATQSAPGTMLTLLGPGGTGKTQLAIAAAHVLLEHFEGAFLVALEGVAGAAAVPAAIGRALGLPDVAGMPAQERVCEHLRERRLLLVVDNAEHLLDAAPEIAALADAARGTRVLVTSQAPLRVRGEQVVPLGPLAGPGAERGDLEALERVPSVALLLARTRAANPAFALTAENAGALAELCVQVDGMPLALELAAARLTLLEPADLAARLGGSLDALGPGQRDLPSRQRGLRAMLDWTTSLLTTAERELLGRLSVFPATFTVAHAEAVAHGDVVAGLATLRDVSLIRREEGGRLGMAPPVRLHAVEGLLAAGIEDDARRRHATAMLAVAEPLRLAWVEDYSATIAAVAAEAPSLRAALAWSADHDPMLHARLVASVSWWFTYAGHGSEIRPHIDRALAHPADDRLRAELLGARGICGMEHLDAEALEVALDAWRGLGDSPDLLLTYFMTANIQAMAGRPADALATAREGRAAAARSADFMLGNMIGAAEAQALFMVGRGPEGLRLARELHAAATPGSFNAMGSATVLADIALDEGEPAEALAAYARALAELRGHHPRNIAFQLDGLAWSLAALGRDDEALQAAAVCDLVRHEFLRGPVLYTLAKREEALAPVRARAGSERESAARERAAALGIAGGLTWAAELHEP